jgi:hypothetical protein
MTIVIFSQSLLSPNLFLHCLIWTKKGEGIVVLCLFMVVS